MREILFRGKRLDNGEWATCRSIIHSLDNVAEHIFMPQLDSKCKATISNVTGNLLGINECVFLKVDPATIGQYTGLCDKNGKKIFENDIVRFDCIKRATPTIKMKGKVFFEEETCAFSVEGFFAEITQFLCDLSGTEVIGNIHDNPELLG